MIENMGAWRLALAILGASVSGATLECGSSAPSNLRVLVVGGGPSKKYNQVGIESNVRYMERLLPSGAKRRVLFADGEPESETVLYEDEKRTELYRKPKIERIDGPSVMPTVREEFALVGDDAKATPNARVLLYFTGHGSPDRGGRYENNSYDLWDKTQLTVRDLSSQLEAIPKTMPTTLVMVQCFSGGFGNLLFEGGDPQGKLTGRRLCGFFASVPQRMSAGCTPTTDESEYKDFTGYFFAALTGTDRMGRKVTGADFNRDGKIGMNEAFAYSLIHDESIDTPVCTSDTFLRHFVTTPDPEIFSGSYPEVLKNASPSQRAALEGLRDYLKLSGDGLLNDAYTEFSKGRMDAENDRFVHLVRFVRLAKSVVLSQTLRRTGDAETKRAYDVLLRDEASNPFATK